MGGATLEVGAAPALTLEQLLHSIAQRLGRTLELGRLPFTGIALADALAQVPGAELSDADSFISRFAIAEAPDLGEYQKALPMRRVDIVEELRTYPWGAAPPRPGDPLPVLQPPDDAGLPLFVPGEELRGAGGLPGHVAARFGRVDPFGRVEKSGDPASDSPSTSRGEPPTR
jgi:hypothetical protein